MRILGIDYGDKRTGFALGDSLNGLAVPYGVMETEQVTELIERIKQLILEEDIELLVVGEPRSLSGAVSLQTKKTQDFIEILKGRVAITVESIDERWTTKLSEIVSKKNRRSSDELAAMYLLQDYLDKNKSL